MVYFVSDGVYTKIGKSKNPYKRIRDLQTSNPSKLFFTYLFDVHDKYEQTLHKLFKEYKTDSNNEWFNLNNINIETIILGSLKNIPKFNDIPLAKFKANQLNESLNKDFTQVKKDNKNILNENFIKLILEDIKYCLKYKKEKRISYSKYMKDYNFTKEQISFFVKSARLNKLVAKHNNNL